MEKTTKKRRIPKTTKAKTSKKIQKELEKQEEMVFSEQESVTTDVEYEKVEEPVVEVQHIKVDDIDGIAEVEINEPKTVVENETVSESVDEDVEENIIEPQPESHEEIEPVVEENTKEEPVAEEPVKEEQPQRPFGLKNLVADIDGSKRKQQKTMRQVYGYDHFGLIYE